MNKNTKRKKSNKKSDMAITNVQDKKDKENKPSSSDIQETEEDKGSSKPIGATATAQDIGYRIKDISFGDTRDIFERIKDISFGDTQDIDERIKDISFGDTQDIDKSSSDYFSPTNSPQCVAGKLEDGGNNKITSDVQSETQSFEENTTNQNKSTTDICANDTACDNQTVEKKKKQRKRNRKNAKAASNPSEGQEIASPSSVSEKEKSQTVDFDQNAVVQRIIQIESQRAESEPVKARIKSFKEMKKKVILDIKKKQADFLNTVDSLDDDLDFDDVKNNSSIRPIIILMDKATQTDTLPQYQSIPKSNDNKSDITLYSNSDTLIETKPITSTLHQSIEEADQKTDSE